MELYFDAHSGKNTKNSTSDRTLRSLKQPQMRPEQLSKVLKEHHKISEKGAALFWALITHKKCKKIHTKLFARHYLRCTCDLSV